MMYLDTPYIKNAIVTLSVIFSQLNGYNKEGNFFNKKCPAFELYADRVAGTSSTIVYRQEIVVMNINVNYYNTFVTN